MCGIVGYIGKRQAAPILMAGLNRLEYRGYDSAGIAIANKGALKIAKRKGRVRELDELKPLRFKGTSGIAHTRWATNGEPSDRNAHPHSDSAGRYAVVHNGIIENAAALRAQLAARGTTFSSDTDTEVIAHLIALMDDGSPLEAVVSAVLKLVVGTYGLAVMDAERPDVLVVARNGSPVVLGLGDKEMLFGSDASAFVRHATSVVHLDDGEIAVVRADGYETRKLDGTSTVKTPSAMVWKDESFDKGAFDHYMRKEIADQPEALRRTLGGRLEPRFQTTHLGGITLTARELLDVRRIRILGCGAAYIAGVMGAHLIEQLARIPCQAEPASEFRYRNPVIEMDTLYIAVSQSGETFDTLAAVQEIKRKGGRVLGIVNVVGSTIARECGQGIYLHAGPEIAVVSTKTFTCSVVALALLAVHLGRLARPVHRQRCAPAQGARRPARSRRGHPRARGRDRPPRRLLPGRRARLLCRPGRGPCHRHGRGAEAQGDQLSPRRGLSRLRAQARAAGPGDAADADGDRPAARRSFRQERLDHRGGEGARRTGPRHHASGRRRTPRSTARSRCRRSSPSSIPCSCTFRCSSSPITWRGSADATSTSRATSRNPSRSSKLAAKVRHSFAR